MAMLLGESDTDWNDSEEEISDSEDLSNLLIQAQEDMVDPLQVAQDIPFDDDNNEPDTVANSITTSTTCQVPSTSNTSGPTSLPTPSFASVPSLPSACQPSTASSVTVLSNRRVPIQFAQHVGPTEVSDSKSTPLDFFLQIFGKDTFDHIAEQTNLYAFQNPPSARYNWSDTNPQKLCCL